MGKPEWVGAYPRDLGPSNGSVSREKGKDNEEEYGGRARNFDERNEKGEANVSQSGSVQKIENVETVQEVRQPKLSRTRRLWRHYKRHWGCYFILGIVALAIGLPIM
jgi:hypothetical protein